MSVKLATRLIEPDHWTGPAGERQRPIEIRTYGPEVADVNAAADYAPDPQQELMLDLTFAVRPDGSPEAFSVAGIATRQNLKTGWLVQSMIGFVHVLDIPEVMYTAHVQDTATEALRTTSQVMLGSPLLSKHLPAQRNRGVYEGKADERIELTRDRKLWFKTRTTDGGRGLARRRVILDEYFAAQAAHVGALIPTMAAMFQPQVLMASSAPKAKSHLLHDLIRRGRSGSSPRLAYCEWCAPFEPCADEQCMHPKDARIRGIDCALDREHLVLHANPTAVNTSRMSLETLIDFRQEMPAAEYMRECLGWGEPEEREDDAPAIDLEAFKKLGRPNAKKPAAAAIMLDVSPDRKFASIGVAGKGRKGKTLVIEQTRPGTAWVVPALAKLLAKRRIVKVALHPRSQAAVLLRDLIREEIEYDELTTSDLGEACSTWLVAVDRGELEHVGQASLLGAVANAITRNNGEVELWDRRDVAGANISPLVAGSGARLLWERHAADDYDIEDSLL